MAKISELSDGGSLQSTDFLIAVRSGGNVKVQADGNLNLGTVTADGLTVDHSVDTAATFTRTSANTYRIEHDLNQFYFWNATTSEAPLLFQNDGDVIMNAGNVGIGTASPGAKLQVSNGADADLVFLVRGADDTTEYMALGVNGADGVLTAGASGSESTNMVFKTASSGTEAEAMRIDSAGSIIKVSGSNTTLPAISTSPIEGEVRGLEAAVTTIDSGLLRLSAGGGTTVGVKTGIDIFRGATDGSLIRMFTNGSEAARIDSSGNLLVGTTETPATLITTSTTTHEGVGIADGFLSIVRDLTGSANSGGLLFLNRLATDGPIAEFRKDGSTVGNIGATGGDLFIGTGDAGLWFQDGGNAIRPFRVDTQVGLDNSISLGVATTGRFADAYIVNGVTTGSDGNDKQDIETLSDAEQRVAVACKGLLRKWRWKDAVEAKGDEARIHFGIIAQDLQAAFEAEGLDAGRYAMFMSNTWTDEETGEERTRLGVRYHELLAFIIAAI